ncbi:hypothetical protein ES703_71569 [subsurface metagenome]
MGDNGRAAKLIIDGPEGCIRELWFCEEGMRSKPPDVEIKNIIYMTEDVLLDLITPNVDTNTLVALVENRGGIEAAISQIYPRLDFRTALANRLVTIDGERPDVDSEEWAQIIEKFLLRIAFPIVVRGLLKGRKHA